MIDASTTNNRSGRKSPVKRHGAFSFVCGGGKDGGGGSHPPGTETLSA